MAYYGVSIVDDLCCAAILKKFHQFVMFESFTMILLSLCILKTASWSKTTYINITFPLDILLHFLVLTPLARTVRDIDCSSLTWSAWYPPAAPTTPRQPERALLRPLFRCLNQTRTWPSRHYSYTSKPLQMSMLISMPRWMLCRRKWTFMNAITIISDEDVIKEQLKNGALLD